MSVRLAAARVKSRMTDPFEGDQQMQFVTEDRHFLAWHFAKVRAIRCPIAAGARHQMELHHGYRQTVDDANRIGCPIQQLQHRQTDQIESIHQGAPPPIEAALRGNVRKQGAMFPPITQHFGFHLPSPAFAHQRHRQQFTIAALGGRSRTLEQRGDSLPDLIHQHIHPQAKIVKIVYHQLVSRFGWVGFGN